MSIETAASLVRGPAGTTVQLLLQHQGRTAPLAVSLTRAHIEVPTVRSALRLEGQRRIGYIHLSEFGNHAAEQMRQAIEALNRQHVDGFVLDLRSNPGGLVDQALDIARMWLDNGEIVRTVDRNGISEELRADHAALTHLPLFEGHDCTLLHARWAGYQSSGHRPRCPRQPHRAAAPTALHPPQPHRHLSRSPVLRLPV